MAISATQLDARAKVTTTTRPDGLVFVHAPRLADGTTATARFLTSEAAKVLGTKSPVVTEQGTNNTPHTRAPHGATWAVFGA